MQVLRQSGYALARWKNGAGSSLEVAMGGPPGEPFAWRVSLASVERSGPFSDYSGYDRTTALVEGAGFTLRAPGAATLRFAAPGDCHAYAGSLPYVCELHDGPCRDLNLIARSGLGASMSVVVLGEGGLALDGVAARRYVLPLSGHVSVRAGETGVRLDPCDAALLGPREAGHVQPDGMQQPAASGRAPTIIALLRIPA